MRWVRNVKEVELQDCVVVNGVIEKGQSGSSVLIKGNIVGDPREVGVHTVEELKTLGLVGIYASGPGMIFDDLPTETVLIRTKSWI